jgi:hypothetical protein
VSRGTGGVSPRGGALTGAGFLCRRFSGSRLGGRPLRGRPLRGGPLGRRLLRRSFLRGPRPQRFGVTHCGRDAVSEGGGVSLDEFACCAVTCSASVGGLGHLPCALLTQPSVPQVPLDLLRAHQSFVPFFRDRYDRPSVTTRGLHICRASGGVFGQVVVAIPVGKSAHTHAQRRRQPPDGRLRSAGPSVLSGSGAVRPRARLVVWDRVRSRRFGTSPSLCPR